ncbi:MAG: pre-16S rRNA-processing nuclease YqgF [Bacillota bacterium]|nr:pre-16S rRNA-processing nuclease YqgF [Bacillota bacterium]
MCDEDRSRPSGGGRQTSRGKPPEVVIAVDPGQDKCGLAAVMADGTVLAKEIVARTRVGGRILEFVRTHGSDTVVLGDRTGSRALAREIETALDRAGSGSVRVVFVDEHESSMEGRRRYLEDHPLRGLGRLVPLSLRTPGEPFDDYVAVVLAERFFHSVET